MVNNTKYYVLTEEEKNQSLLKEDWYDPTFCLFCNKKNIVLEDSTFFFFPFKNKDKDSPNYVCDETCFNLLILSRRGQ